MSLNKDKVVASLSFLVGLVGVSSTINELLKIVLGAGGDGLAVALNAALGVAGVGYYFVRSNAQK